VEVCEGKPPANESDMGLLNSDAISTMCGTGWDRSTTMEGS
jgi:hypothetical protein